MIITGLSVQGCRKGTLSSHVSKLGPPAQGLLLSAGSSYSCPPSGILLNFCHLLIYFQVVQVWYVVCVCTCVPTCPLRGHRLMSVVKPRAHQFGQPFWPANPKVPPESASPVVGLQGYHHAQIFTWVLGIKLRFSCLCSKNFINIVISPATPHLPDLMASPDTDLPNQLSRDSQLLCPKKPLEEGGWTWRGATSDTN